MKKLGRSELDTMLSQNACEIVFLRRRPERKKRSEATVTRKMICSKSMDILRSELGLRALNYYPEGPKQINEALHDIVVVWDIIMQSYRNVSMEYCYLVKKIPSAEFEEYYNKTLAPMSTKQKLQFMDSI